MVSPLLARGVNRESEGCQTSNKNLDKNPNFGGVLQHRDDFRMALFFPQGEERGTNWPSSTAP